MDGSQSRAALSEHYRNESEREESFGSCGLLDFLRTWQGWLLEGRSQGGNEAGDSHRVRFVFQEGDGDEAAPSGLGVFWG